MESLEQFSALLASDGRESFFVGANKGPASAKQAQLGSYRRLLTLGTGSNFYVSLAIKIGNYTAWEKIELLFRQTF